MKIIDNNEIKAQPIDDLRKAICADLQKHDYQFFCCLNLPSYDVVKAEKYLKKWRIEMCVKDNIRIAYKGLIVLSQERGPHIHLLMFGRNKHNETLLDKNEIDWQNAWQSLTHESAFIEKVYDLQKVSEYISSSRNTPIDHFELLIPYNTKLLKRYEKQSR